MQGQIENCRDLLRTTRELVDQMAGSPRGRYTRQQIDHARQCAKDTAEEVNALGPFDALGHAAGAIRFLVRESYSLIYIEPHAHILDACIRRAHVHDRRRRYARSNHDAAAALTQEDLNLLAHRPGKEPAHSRPTCKWCKRGPCFLRGFVGKDEENGGVFHLA